MGRSVSGQLENTRRGSRGIKNLHMHRDVETGLLVLLDEQLMDRFDVFVSTRVGLGCLSRKSASVSRRASL
jgi:hypothetical protein